MVGQFQGGFLIAWLRRCQRKLFCKDVSDQRVNALIWPVSLKECLVVAAQNFGQGRRNSGGATHSRVAVQHDAAQLFVQGKDEAPDLSCIIAGKETIWAVFFRGQITVEKREAEDSQAVWG